MLYEVITEIFKPQEYWSIVASLATGRNDRFTARVAGADGKKLGRLDISYNFV